ncbi:unnamed protein product [Mytilus edulis]|uniref:Uncharacterized protein n=1 Tax=Mytilus edulis TaxID=6550 RepID=A0A8S3SYP3_MYTED|nr:unnamed protein product [Mytilus edulis]
MGNENSTVIYKNIYQDPYDTLPLVLTLISAPLSIVGALFIFITFSLVDEARNETRKLLVCLTISDFIMAISSTVGNVRYAVKYGKSEIIELACPSTECDYLCLIHGSVKLGQTYVHFLDYNHCIPFANECCFQNEGTLFHIEAMCSWCSMGSAS